MGTEEDNPIKRRCAYVMNCYLAEELRCFGFKVDCPLYRQTKDDNFDQGQFDEAMDELINQAKSKHTKPQKA